MVDEWIAMPNAVDDASKVNEWCVPPDAIANLQREAYQSAMDHSAELQREACQSTMEYSAMDDSYNIDDWLAAPDAVNGRQREAHGRSPAPGPTAAGAPERLAQCSREHYKTHVLAPP